MCVHITWQVLEETRLFFDQRLGPNYFTNKVPRRFPTADLGGLIKDVRRNKFLDSVIIPRQWNNQENINTWGTHQGKSQGGYMQVNGVYSVNAQRPKILDPYSTQARKGIQNLRGKRWQTQNSEHRHPVLVKFMAKFLQTYSTPYFEKVLVAGNKTTKDLPKYGRNLHGKRDMCMHHILEKCRNPNFSFYHAQKKWMDSQYAANVCTVIAPGMDYIWMHGAEDIQIPDPVGSKCNMDNLQQNSGDAKRRYEEARHLIGASQGEVSENMEKLILQGSNVKKTRFRINS